MAIAVKKTETMLTQFVTQRRHAKAPVPLKAVSYNVEIVSGLAIVKQKRVFRNDEKQPIEATLTFPVGYDSVVSDVRATVDGRLLVGVAKAKQEARKTYEKALDDGKATVLHEELMRGLHMVSAGNIASGAEITVEATYVAPLAMVAGIGRLRIPLTIGAIYGTSPLIASDDILADGAAIDAAVSVRGADGIRINGADASSVTTVKTSAVIDIAVTSPSLAPVHARMPSGSWANVSFAIPAAAARPLDADLMLDTSGSMAEGASRWKTKWQALVEGLGSALKTVDSQDGFRFWTFSNDCILRGAAKGPEAADRMSSIPFDNMGTELAEAVHKVAQSRSEANILLVTDGQSYREIDFDIVRKSGARFTVVLIGRSAFESRVAQLAALTGGQMFVVDPSDDVAAVASAALLSMRSAASPVKANDDPEASVERVIGGLEVSVAYSAEEPEGRETPHAAAFAAALAVSALPSDAAGKLAEAVGIVTHLTSIVMVDYEGGEVDGIAVTRKVGLAEPDESGVILAASAAPVRVSAFYSAPSLVGAGSLRSMNLVAESLADAGLEAFGGGYVAPDSAADVGGAWLGRPRGIATKGIGGHVSKKVTKTVETVETTIVDTGAAGFWGQIEYPFGSHDVPTSMFDWTLIAEVINGKNSLGGGFDEKYALILSARIEVVELAKALGKDILHVALALIASKKGDGNRMAERIVRKVLDGADPAKLAAALAQIPG
ncbi:VIT domain-containing protein [Pararhizobium sp. BT-229]|uniref:VIT domain-containing protein n=1 Tax=Pararhizobium sp. BT-229 TaxID=2986923 RepID=UPI0021F73A6A|nr:VIT domain-containing protein [Pararhizobium sp. BT-229]MCV9964411.1 VIT domain-containing protein [Pararhizobium sp. BT-229]